MKVLEDLIAGLIVLAALAAFFVAVLHDRAPEAVGVVVGAFLLAWSVGHLAGRVLGD